MSFCSSEFLSHIVSAFWIVGYIDIGLVLSFHVHYHDIMFEFRMMSDYIVDTPNDRLNEFSVEFHGPKESVLLTSLPPIF